MSKHSVRKFWPLDFDPEGEIYESLAWDLAGNRRPGSSLRNRTVPSRPSTRRD